MVRNEGTVGNGRLRDLARAEGRAQAHRRAESGELPVLRGGALPESLRLAGVRSDPSHCVRAKIKQAATR